MPLFVNGEWFNPALKKEEQPSAHRKLKEDYDNFIFREAANFKYPVELRVKRTMKRLTDSRGTPVQPPTDNLNYRQSVQSSDGTEAWVYQKKFPQKKDGEYTFIDMGEWIRGSIRIQPSEKDKLYYLFKKSGRVGSTLIHHDPEAIARKRAEDNALKAQLYFQIYNFESPLVKEPRRLKELAQSFGVRKVSSLSIPEVQNALFDIVNAGDDVRTRGPRKFLEAASDYDTASKEAQIQEAIEKEVIVFNSAESEWRFLSRGQETSTIYKVDEGGSKVEALLEYLKRHPMIENRILIAARTGKLTELKPEDIDGLNKAELDRECKIAGVRGYAPGRSKEDVKDDLREWVEFYNNVKA